jgi:hypothetical protein
MSRYSKTCPTCGTVILPSDVPYGEDSFPCPSCGEWLTYDKRYTPAIWVGSVLIAIVISLRLGYRDAMFILVAGGATWIVGLLGIFIVGLLFPPPLKRVQGKPFDKPVSLHLTDRSEGNKKTGP